MVAATIIFTLPKDTNWDEIKTRALDRAANVYTGLEGLRTKGFVYNKETHEYGGLYFWENKDALDNFIKSDLIQQAAAKLGQPQIKIYDVAAYIENGKLIPIENIDSN